MFATAAAESRVVSVHIFTHMCHMIQTYTKLHAFICTILFIFLCFFLGDNKALSARYPVFGESGSCLPRASWHCIRVCVKISDSRRHQEYVTDHERKAKGRSMQVTP